MNRNSEVLSIYNEVMKKVLLYGEASLPKPPFDAFRKLVLNEFGKTGAEGKVRKLFTERNGQAQEGS